MTKLICFDYECGKVISDVMLFEILTQHNLSELYDKKKRFEEQKDLDSDPLIRWCPKAGCGKCIKAKDENDVHLTC